MKNPFIRIATLLCAVLLTVQVSTAQTVRKTIPAPDYNALVAQHGINVTLTKRPLKEIVIKADKSMIDFVKVTCEKGTLSVGIDSKYRNIIKGRSSVEITVPLNSRLQTINAMSAADVRSELPIKGEHVTFQASSSARIVAAAQCTEFNGQASSSADLVIAVEAAQCSISATSAADVKCSIKADESRLSATSSAEIDAENYTRNRCMLNATSSGEIELEGTSRDLFAKATSGSEIKAEDFYVGNAEAQASSGAKIELNFTYKLTANASSAGRIFYTGPGTDIDAHTSTGGNVKPLK